MYSLWSCTLFLSTINTPPDHFTPSCWSLYTLPLFATYIQPIIPHTPILHAHSPWLLQTLSLIIIYPPDYVRPSPLITVDTPPDQYTYLLNTSTHADKQMHTVPWSLHNSIQSLCTPWSWQTQSSWSLQTLPDTSTQLPVITKETSPDHSPGISQGGRSGKSEGRGFESVPCSFLTLVESN